MTHRGAQLETGRLVAKEERLNRQQVDETICAIATIRCSEITIEIEMETEIICLKFGIEQI